MITGIVAYFSSNCNVFFRKILPCQRNTDFMIPESEVHSCGKLDTFYPSAVFQAYSAVRIRFQASVRRSRLQAALAGLVDGRQTA